MASRHWEDLDLESPEREVFEALDDPRWDYRSVDGLKKATGLSEEKVREVLNKYPEYIHKSPVPDEKGRDIYTLREREHQTKDVLRLIRTFASKSI